MAVPGLFETSLLADASKRRPSQASRFMRPIHPKSDIAPDRDAIDRVLTAGWWGQPKVHGHRAQIHIPPQNAACLVYNRQGRLHAEVLSESINAELHRLFAPSHDWNVIDAEWLKPEQKIFVFDFLKKDGETLSSLTYSERYALLPQLFISRHISTLPIFKTSKKCCDFLKNLPPSMEGLVFRSPQSPGFKDSSIVRCRKT